MLGWRDLSVRYKGTSEPALRPCSAALGAGQLVALVGPNGSGKSTLLRALAGAVPADGEVHDHDRIRPAGRPADPRWLAWLPQQPGWDAQGTVAELVELGRTPWLGRTAAGRFFGQPSAADGAAVDRALERAALSERRDSRLNTLSGGQRQRVFLAMILAQGSPVLLLDEPTASLDLPQAARTLALLRDEARAHGGLVVLATHDLVLALRYADQVAVLGDGNLINICRPGSEHLRPALEAAFGAEIAAYVPLGAA